MKTTNYEISEKLAEIGFEREEYFYLHKKDDPGGEKLLRSYVEQYRDINDYYPSYDLGTILEALPKKLSPFLDPSKDQLNIKLYKHGHFICYTNEWEIYGLLDNEETLVDSAARLLIKILEEQIEKQKNEKDLSL